MDEHCEGAGRLQRTCLFFVRSLLPGILLYAFPSAILALSIQSSFLSIINHYGTQLGVPGDLLFLLFGVALGSLLHVSIRKQAVTELSSIFSAGIAMLLPIPDWISLILSGTAAGGFSCIRTGEKRNYMLFGVVVAVLGGYILGAAWFCSLLYSEILPYAALLSFAAASLLSFLPQRRFIPGYVSLLLAGVALEIFVCHTMLSPVEKLGVQSIYTPYGALYSLETGHGRKIYDAEGHLLKNGDIPALRMSVLPAALQCMGENGRVLYIGYTPSEIPALFRRMPNIREVEVLSFSGDFAKEAVTESPVRTLRRFQKDFDLIFIAELPPCDISSQTSFLNRLKQNLRENGVLVFSSDIHSAEIGSEPLPGAGSAMRIYGKDAIIRDWPGLESRFRELCIMSEDGMLSPALLSALKNEFVSTPKGDAPARGLSAYLKVLLPARTWGHILLAVGIGYLLARFLLGRKGNFYFLFSSMENGFTLALMLLCGVRIFSRYSLQYSLFPAALLLLVCLLDVRGSNPKLCRLLRGSYLLAIGYLALPILRMNFDPMIVLTPLLVLGSAGSGVIQRGIVVRGKSGGNMAGTGLLLGMLLGCLFFALSSSESAGMLIGFALFLRILYMIRM